MLSSEEIEKLLSQQSISENYPWNTNDEQVIDNFYRRVCAAVSLKTNARSRIEWNHYGSGYASYFDAWFYKTDSEFALNKSLNYGQGYKGLVVLLSRLSPYFVFMEGEQTWHSQGGGSYLPAFDVVDHIPTTAVASLAEEIQPILKQFGLVRLFREDLLKPLVGTQRIPTILTDKSFTEFDALFYWED